jgi:5-methyltetrahydropteroyltriglutamate--homocysteine methyltransferase
MKHYFEQKHTASWSNYINSAVGDMVDAGINIITDGQTRDPFIQLFTRKLNGCRIRNRVEIIDSIEYLEPITVKDQQYVRTIVPSETMIKGVITGPYTLAKSCSNSFYKNEQQLVYAFADVLKQETQRLQPHVDMISIDEPYYVNEMPPYGKDLINNITKNITCPIILHICGDISPILPEILEMPVDILSHEFKALPHLLDTFKQYSFPQKICLGSVRSDNPTVESVEEITVHIQQAITIFDNKLIHIAPDCGQRLLPRNSAYQKLWNLVQAGERINER